MKWLGQEAGLVNKRTEGQWLAVQSKRRMLVGWYVLEAIVCIMEIWAATEWIARWR